MAYDIEIVELEPQPVLVMQANARPEQLGQMLGSMFGRVHQYLVDHDAVLAGMPFMRYIAMTDRIQIEAGMPNPGEIPGEGDVINRVLPGGRTATTLFVGEYHLVGEAWTALFDWAAAQGTPQRWGGWDVYENDPDSVSDPSELRTRLYLPLD